MVDTAFLFGISFVPVQAAAAILLSLAFGLQAKAKARTYILAIQPGFGAIIIGQFTITLFASGVSPLEFFNNFTSVSLGVLLGHIFFSWLIITLVFFVRFRNHNERIFTRNRAE